MRINNYFLSNHAFSRLIERLLLSQNIKLNKRQKEHNKNKAINKIRKDLNNNFGCSYYKGYKAIYTNLKNNNTCTKYIISDKNTIVTIINNINIYDEMNKYSICFKKNINLS